MFYRYVERKMKQGLVSVGLPAQGYPGAASFEAKNTLTALAIRFLSANERQELVELAKKAAIARRYPDLLPEEIPADG